MRFFPVALGGSREICALPAALARAALRCRRGASAVEFALVAPLVIGAIVELMQLGFYVYQSSHLAQAVARASRQIQVGSVASAGASASDFKTQFLCPALGAMMPCDRVTTSIQTVAPGIYPNGFYAYVRPDFSDIIRMKTDGSQTPYCPGQPGTYVYVQAAYAMPVFSPIWLAAALRTNRPGARLIDASAVFRNEPYTSSGQAQATC